MAFPQTPLPIKQEMLINGTWTDITSRTRGADEINISRGYSGEQANLSAGTCSFKLNNRDNFFSNNNPLSANYRKIGRNVQYRNGVDSGTTSVRFLDAAAPGTQIYDGSTIYAPDSASLDITGDIDVSVDVEFDDISGRNGNILLSKWQAAGVNQRSWLFTTTASQQLQFSWSPDGTLTNRIFATCPGVIAPTGRVQYRATLDVDNGAGGWTVSFYVGAGPNITGTWNLINSVSGTGTTSIFNSTARVECGTITLGASWPSIGTGTDANPFVGKFYAARIRNGINGGLVANLRADQTAVGTTSWTDSTGVTWTITGSSYISSTDYRFWGEIPSLPNRADSTGKDIYMPVTANDIVARLSTGKFTKPLNSPVFHNLSQYAWDGYWPMEQESTSTTVNAYVGKMGNLASATFNGATTDFAGSAGFLSANDDNGFSSGYATVSSGTLTTTTYMFYMRMTQLPGSASYARIMDFFPQGGTAYRVSVYANNVGYRLIIIDSSGTSLVDTIPGGFGTGISPLNWTAMRVKLSVSAGTVTCEWAWYQLNASTIVGTTATYSGSLGRPLKYEWPAWNGKSGMQIAHVAMGSFDFNFTSASFISSTNAYAGESWLTRARRLAAENNFPIFIEGVQSYSGDTSFIHAMGVQGLKTLVDLFKECADVAGGQLYAPRSKFGLAIRSFEQIANQAGPSLDYSAAHLSGSIEPEPDVFLIENDVTLTIPTGASFRYAQTTGTLNTGDPAASPDAVGTYDVSDAINLYKSGDIEQFVRRRVMFGTWDEPRYPSLLVQLERSPFVNSATLTAYCRKVDLLRPVTLINLATWLSFNPVNLMVVGYQETMSQFTHKIKWNLRPGGPWQTGVWGSSGSRTTTTLWGAKSTTLQTGVNSTATSLTFTTPDAYETWSTTASGYQVEIDGERMTIVSVGARSGTGPFTYAVTVIRNANGAAHALSAGRSVTVVNQGRWA